MSVRVSGRIAVWSSDGLAATNGGVGSRRVGRNVVWPNHDRAKSSTHHHGSNSYHADAVHFDGNTFLRRASALSGILDNPKGIVSFWAKDFFSNPDDGPSGATTISNGDGDYLTVGATGLAFPKARAGAYLTDESYASTFDFDTDDLVLVETVWNHLLMSWDVGFDPGSRRLAIYVNDVLKVYTVNTDSGDSSFVIHYAGIPTTFGSSYPFFNAARGDCADVYINFVDTIVEPGNTISESNRRKFITASGKPADISSFPANGTMVFSGDATAFSNNRGSGGAFLLHKMVTCNTISSGGPQSVVCTGLVAGQTVDKVWGQFSRDISSEFESTVSVNNQIQQTGSTDYTGEIVKVTVAGSLTNASTSPSD